MPTPAEVIARRRRQRSALVRRARAFTEELAADLGTRAVVVVGSVARGDFHSDSDVDVLVVADHVPDDPVERQRAVGAPVAGLDIIVWTPREWSAQARRGDPIAVDAREHGVWLLGSAGGLEDPPAPRS